MGNLPDILDLPVDHGTLGMLTGFDCLDENEIRTRGLMGVRQNFYGLGKAAIELILTILDGKAYRPIERIGGITVLP